MRKLFFLMAILALACVAYAQTTGSWTLHPAQPTLYSVQVQAPIDADGNSVFKSGGRAVIPVKFTLSTAFGSVVFMSIGSNTSTSDDYSSLSFSPSAALTVSQITGLQANYSFKFGNCHGGALRWSVGTAKGSLFIYYGAAPNFTSCSGADSQSGVNMVGLQDLRYDTSQVGGSFYDSYGHAMSLIGNEPVQFVALVLDGGWGGNQGVELTSATINDNTWTPSPSGVYAPTCALPLANIKVTKTVGADSGAAEEAESVQPADNNMQFRVADCKYVYNLATSSLPGVGTYKVEVVVGKITAKGAATLSLK